MKVILSEDEVAEIKEAFKRMDVDGNGTVTSEELKKVMKEQGENIPEVFTEVMVAMADTNGDGKISYEEFVQMAIDGPPDLTDDQIFKIFDKNGDGFISFAEMKKLSIVFGEDLSNAEINEIIKEADLSGDGRVSFREFEVAMNS
jgi:calmodulin